MVLNKKQLKIFIVFLLFFIFFKVIYKANKCGIRVWFKKKINRSMSIKKDDDKQ